MIQYSKEYFIELSVIAHDCYKVYTVPLITPIIKGCGIADLIRRDCA